MSDIFKFPSADVRSSNKDVLSENVSLYNCEKMEDEDPGRGFEDTAKEGPTYLAKFEQVSTNMEDVAAKEELFSGTVPVVNDVKDVFDGEEASSREVTSNVSPMKDPEEELPVNDDIPTKCINDYSPPQYQPQTIEVSHLIFANLR